MLVLTRKLDESIRIGDDIKITVLRVKGNTVRIGIEAPRNVRVARSELKALEEDSSNATAALGIAANPDCQIEGALVKSDPSSSTVAAIVDSPTIASPRLFVGKLTKGNVQVDLQEQPPLRDFLRTNRSLSAVS